MSKLSCVILAGGQGRRMAGQDKGLLKLGEQTFVSLVAQTLAPQVDELLIVANRHENEYRCLGYPVLNDLRADYPGPLAGIETGLAAAQFEQVIFFPVDTPCPPPDYVARMRLAAMQGSAVASVAGQIQSVCLLTRRNELSALQSRLDAGERQVKAWLRKIGAVSVDFSDCAQHFRDVDSAADFAALETPKQF